MKKVLMYTTHVCPFCVMAKRLLQRKGVAWEEIFVDVDLERRSEMVTRSGRRTVPQIFIGEKHVGGFEEIRDLERDGELDPLLADDAGKKE
jgi:glutaredoxin 3